MMPLDTCQARSPAENLHISQGSTFAHRARKAKRVQKIKCVWRLGTWNVRSMVDTEGPIEVASQGTERGEDRKVDLVVSELARYNVMWWLVCCRRPSGLAVGR